MKRSCENKVVLLGNIAFDLFALPKKTRQGIVFTALPGGSVSNTALILSRLGLDVALVSKTGADFLSDTLVSALEENGIDTKYVFRDKKVVPSLAFADLDRKGDSTYTFYKTPGGIDMTDEITDIPSSLFKGASVFHTGSIFSYDDSTHKGVLSLARLARKNGAFTVYDPNWRPYRIKDKKAARERVWRLLPHVDLLKLSGEGALGITGCRTLAKALEKLSRAFGCRIVVTLGRKGSFWFVDGKRIHQDIFRVKTADTIGAGDAFSAGLIFRYVTLGGERFDAEKKEDLEFASALSALIVSARGATSGVRDLGQVRNFLSCRSFYRRILPL